MRSRAVIFGSSDDGGVDGDDGVISWWRNFVLATTEG